MSGISGRQVDIAKLCDVIQPIPRIPLERLVGIIRDLREQAAVYNDLLPPRADEEVSKLDQLLREESVGVLAAFGETLITHLAVLLDNARTLSHVDRRTRALWAGLHGEIDWWDLFLLTVLRFSVPAAFDFLIRQQEVLRRPERDEVLRRVERTGDDALTEAWNVVLKTAPFPKAISEIVAELGFGKLSGGANQGKRPQGVRLREPVDYLFRYLNEELMEGEVRDQEVLRDIDEWRKGVGTTLVDRLSATTDGDRQYARQWEAFASDAEDLNLLELVDQMIERLRPVEGGNVLRHDGIISVWRQAGRQNRAYPDAEEWLTLHATEALATSLHLSNGFYYFWASSRYGLVDSDGRARVREAVYQEARRLYEDDLSALATALEPNLPASIDDLVFPADHEESKPSLHRDPKDWQWLGGVLVRGATENPLVFLPQIARLIGEFSVGVRIGTAPRVHPEPYETYQISETRLDGIFGPQRSVVLELLSRDLPGSDDSALLPARKEARRLLSRPAT